jgi:hypothetical protein
VDGKGEEIQERFLALLGMMIEEALLRVSDYLLFCSTMACEVAPSIRQTDPESDEGRAGGSRRRSCIGRGVCR